MAKEQVVASWLVPPEDLACGDALTWLKQAFSQVRKLDFAGLGDGVGKVDALFIHPSHPRLEEAERLAAQAGLYYPYLVQREGVWLWAVVRFGSHKWVMSALSKDWDCREIRPMGDQVHERCRKLLNRMHDGVVEMDADDVIRWANSSIRQLFGPEELAGHKLESLVESHDIPQLRTLREQHASGVVVAFPLKLRNGTLVEVDPTPRYDDQGKLLGTSMVFRGVGQEDQDVARARELFALYSIATAMGQGHDVRSAVNNTIEHTLELLEIEYGGAVIDEKTVALHGFEGGSALKPLLDFCEGIPDSKKVRIARTLPESDPLLSLGLGSVAAVPLRVNENQLGVLWFASKTPGQFAREVVSLLISVANQLAVVVENQLYHERQLQAESERKKFYRDALCAVTQGKLHLTERQETDQVWEESGQSLGRLEIVEAKDVPQVRRLVEKAMEGQDLAEERVADLALCATEAVGNVIKHADSGLVEVKGCKETIRVLVDDNGPGIDFAHLPSAVLTAGYSTAPSLGMGYSILLEMLDRVFLCTGEGGTTLILEMVREEPDPLDAFIGMFPD